MGRALWLAFGLFLAGDAIAQDGGAPAPVTCVTSRTEARYSGYGYDHLVHLRSACEAVARCSVSTNVNPAPQTVRLEPGREATVVTFRGSPAREFTARVECALETPRR